jgi:hypothetical protein
MYAKLLKNDPGYIFNDSWSSSLSTPGSIFNVQRWKMNPGPIFNPVQNSSLHRHLRSTKVFDMIFTYATDISISRVRPFVFCFASVQNCETYPPMRGKKQTSFKKTKLPLHVVWTSNITKFDVFHLSTKEMLNKV